MNSRLALALLPLAGLPLHAGDAPASAKGGLPPEPASAKEIVLPKDAGALLAPPAPSTRWTLGAGVSWRKIGFVDFDTGSTKLLPPNLFGDNTFTPPAGIGPARGFVERNYDDGFVHPGPRVEATGRTTAYGYTNQGQLQGDNLVYTATGGERRIVEATRATSSTGWYDGTDWEAAPYLKLSRLTDVGNGWSAGPTIHFNLTSIDASRNGQSTLRAGERLEVYDVTATDTYDSSGLILPDAPYTGSPGAVAPLLPAEPADRTFTDALRSTDVALFQDSIHEDFDLDLFGLSLGGEAVYRSNSPFFGSLGAGLVLNIADWDASRRDRLLATTNGGESVVVDSNRRSSSGTDLLLGFYFQGSVGYQLSKTFAVEATARYDWNQRIDDSVGTSDFEVELTGFSLGVGCTYTFW